MSGDTERTKWRSLKTADAVIAAARAGLADDATPFQVAEFAWEQGMECSDLLDDGTIRCSVGGGRKTLLVSRTWLLRFDFTDDRLSGVTAEEGLQGP